VLIKTMKKDGPFVKNTVKFEEESAEGKKAERTETLHTSTVEIASGKVFDSDEPAQTRMHRAIQVLELTGELTTMWKLADNTFAEVTLDEIKEAFVLAAKQQSDIWLNFG
jgi:hypothetical protein